MSDSQQRLLKTFLTGLPGFLALKNRDLAYEVVNPAFCQFLGKAPNEIVGKKDADLLPAKEAQACGREDAEVIKNGSRRSLEQALTGADGQRWLDVSRSPILDDSGDPAGILLFARDISPFKSREDDVRQRAEALEQREAKQQELAKQAADAEAARQAMEAQAQKLQEQLEAQKGQAAELKAAQAEVQNKEKELAGLQKQFQAAQVQAAKLQEQAQAAQAQAAKVQEELNAVKAQAAQIQAQGAALQKQSEEKDQKLAQLEAALAAVKATNSDAVTLAQQLVDKLKPGG